MEEHDPLKFAGKTWRGRSKESLEKAIENAWEQAKNDVGAPQTLRIVDIYVEGTNPISEYGVIVTAA